jgi:hypothetical protein
MRQHRSLPAFVAATDAALLVTKEERPPISERPGEVLRPATGPDSDLAYNLKGIQRVVKGFLVCGTLVVGL